MILDIWKFLYLHAVKKRMKEILAVKNTTETSGWK